MIISIKNLTQEAIPELGLIADELKYIFYNRPFFRLEGLIRTNIELGKVRLRDEEDNNANEALNETVVDLIQNRPYVMTNIAIEKFYEDVRSAFRIYMKIQRKKENIAGYNQYNLRTDLAECMADLEWGNVNRAINDINNITPNDFFNNNRKAKYASVLQSVLI